MLTARRGLARLIAEASSPVEPASRGPLVIHDSSPYGPRSPALRGRAAGDAAVKHRPYSAARAEPRSNPTQSSDVQPFS